MGQTNPSAPADFIREIIDGDMKTNKHGGRVAHAGFRREPNGYLHIGHAKSICLNFGIAAQYGEPATFRWMIGSKTEKTRSMWTRSSATSNGWDSTGMIVSFSPRITTRAYQYAVQLVKEVKAYVSSLSADEIREFRGTLTEGGKETPDRSR